jgi:hypothetical protein
VQERLTCDNAAFRIGIATHLFASAHGKTCAGDQPCFYCGLPANVPLQLSSSFNEWSSVAFPQSTMICAGCDLALEEKRDMPGRDKPQKVRNYSWLVTPTTATPLQSVADIRAACLAKYDTPWALAIAESGQKHLLWRATVNSPEEHWRVVQFELMRISYTCAQLESRLLLAQKIASAIGKPALTEALTPSLGMRLMESDLVDSDAEIYDWFRRATEPINRLVAYICPTKGELAKC